MCVHASELSAEHGRTVTNSAWSAPVQGLSARIAVHTCNDADPLRCIVRLEIRNVTNVNVHVSAQPVTQLTVEGVKGAHAEPADIDGGGLLPEFKSFTITPGDTKTVLATRPITSTTPGEEPSNGQWLLKPGEYLLRGILRVPVGSAGSGGVAIALEACRIIVTAERGIFLDLYSESY